MAEGPGLFIPEQVFVMSCRVPGGADQLVGARRGFTLESKSLGVPLCGWVSV